MRMILLVPATLLVVTPLAAQGRGREPSTWLTLSGGFLVMNRVVDGTTNSTWDFGNAVPLRVSLERAIGSGSSLGLQALYARAPLLYVSPSTCGTCNAHATVAAYGPVLRLGAARGMWSQVLELFGGVMQYGNITEDRTGEPLPPNAPDHDFAFGIGLDIGYPLSRDFALEFSLSQLRAIHQRTNLLGNAQTMAGHTAFMAGLRVGF